VGHKSARFRVVVALLIALTSLLGALAAWRAEAASMKGDNAERKALTESLANERVRSSIRSDLQDTLQKYQDAQVYFALSRALRARVAGAAPADAARLRALAKADEQLGSARIGLLRSHTDAIRADGTLDLAREFQLRYANEKSTTDLDPRPEYRISDHQATKSERLVGLTAMLIAAAFFFTLAQVGRRREVIPLYLGGGLVVMVAATVLLLLVVFGT
jgi:hypothetical protein